MSIARLAYLTSPAAGRYVLNYQLFGSEELVRVELGPDHMRNILSDGVPLMLRQSFHAEAKGNGYDVKALRTIVRMRKQDANDRAEQEAVLELYMQAMGMV
jgi:hypothetical protein